jgi:hypothetical protein
MFSPLKLAALAKLNFLPSWWFFRQGVVNELPGLVRGGMIDDEEMQRAWNEAIKWCAEVLGDRANTKGIVAEADKVEHEGKRKMDKGMEGEKMEE